MLEYKQNKERQSKFALKSKLGEVDLRQRTKESGEPNIERIHMTSRRPYWCSKTMKRRPYWGSKQSCGSWEFKSSAFHWPVSYRESYLCEPVKCKSLEHLAGECLQFSEDLECCNVLSAMIRLTTSFLGFSLL